MAVSREQQELAVRTGRSGTVIRVVLLAVMLAAFALRIYRLDGQSIWEEEFFSLDLYANKSIPEIIRFNIYAGDPQPPLYYIILHLWASVTSLREFPARFLSVWTSVLAIPVLYRFASCLFGQRVGALAAILLAVNPFHLWYAQEARTYSLTMLLTLMSSLLLVKALRSHRRRWLLIAYVVITNLAIYSHYYTYFVVLAQSGGLLIFWFMHIRRKEATSRPSVAPKSLLPLWIAQAALFVPYLPWAPFAYRTIGAFTGWHEPISPTEIVSSTFGALTVGQLLEEDLAAPATGFFAALFASGVIFGAINKFTRISMGGMGGVWALANTVIYLTLPLVGASAFIQLTGRTVFHERYFIIIAPPLLIILALGIERLRESLSAVIGNTKWRKLSFAAYVALVGPVFALSAVSLNNLHSSPHFQKADLRSAVEYFKSIRQDGDVILTPDAGLEGVIKYYNRGALRLERIVARPDTDRQELLADLAKITRQSTRIWYIPFWGTGAEATIEEWLNDNSYRVSHNWFTKASVIEYVFVKDQDTLARASRTIRFEDAVETVDIALPRSPIRAGGAIPFEIGWKFLDRQQENQRVVFDLVDQNGGRHSRIERSLDEGDNSSDGSACKYGLSVPIGTPPGEYTVEIFVHSNEGVLEAADASGGKIGIHVPVGRIQIAKNETALEGALRIESRTQIDFGDSLQLLGHDLPKVEANPGAPIAFSLYWQARKDIPDRLDLRLTVKDKQGNILGEASSQQVAEMYPTDRWSSGEIVRDIRQLKLSPRVSTGSYQLILSVVESDGEQIGSEVVLAPIRVVSRARSFSLPQVENELDVKFGDIARLRGYDVNFESSADRLHVALYWVAESPSDTNYKVFVHALDRDGNIVGQDDSSPAAGSAPTTSWIDKEVIVDKHSINLPSGIAVASVRVGIYDERSGERQQVGATGDRAIDARLGDDNLLLQLSDQQ